jgi:hypothetical protein
MGSIGIRRLLCLAALGLSGLGPVHAVLASPPIHPRAIQIHRAAPLDLHAPAAAMAAAAAADKPSTAFPSALHPHTVAGSSRIQLPGGTEGPQTRIPNHLEEFARRVHREGLPVARLWENNSALVSVGLNPRGKPGLWLVQKMR